MKKFYGTEIPGSLSPVPATPEMTQPVGVRDGQLFTDPGDVGELTDRVEALEQTTGTLEDNVSELQTDVGEAQSDIETLETGVSSLNGRMTAAESNIGTNAQEIGQLQFDVSQAQTDIVGLGLSKLDKPTNEGDTGDVIVKTANGTEFQPVAPFNPNGTYPNVTAGKAISAKSLENVSEDSGATQTAPFFFQATATANGTEETPTSPVFELKSIRGNTIVYNQLVDGFSATYDTISGHIYWAFHVGQPPVIVTSQGTPISFPSPQSDKLVDLTRWFNGSIPQAILDDPTVFPINYYDGALTYSAGELKNCSCTEFKTVEFNMLPSSLTIGHYWNNGVLETNRSASFASCDNLIRVIPGQTICIALPHIANTIAYYITRFDSQQNYIDTSSSTNINTTNKYSTYQLPSDAVYIAISLYRGTALTSDEIADANLNLSWDGERNGEYAPHVSHTYPLVWSGKSAGSAYDERLPDGTETTRIGSYTITGNETWSAWGAGAYVAGISITCRNDQNVINGISPIGVCRTVTDIYTGAEGFGINNSNLYISSSLYAELASLVGKTIYFVLSSPTTSEGTPYTTEIEGDDYGTMSFDSVVPVGNEFFYPADYALLIDDLGNYTGYDVTKLAKKTDLIPAPTGGDGTYVFKATVSGGTPTYFWIVET